jgi:hypothetical protein
MLTLAKLYMIIAVSNVSGADWRFERQIIMDGLTDQSECVAIAADMQKNQLWHKIYCVEVAQ